MQTREGIAWILVLGLVVSLLLGVGCGDSSQEAALREASEALGSARGRVEGAREKLEERREQLEVAKTKVAAAERELREAQSELREAESRIDLTATDAALFRAVQKRLLEDDGLSEVAIDADVERGVVTLRGSVPKAGMRKRALKIAESVPGVAAVDNRISLTQQPDVAAEGP